MNDIQLEQLYNYLTDLSCKIWAMLEDDTTRKALTDWVIRQDVMHGLFENTEVEKKGGAMCLYSILYMIGEMDTIVDKWASGAMPLS